MQVVFGETERYTIFMMTNYLDELNESQRAAVLYCDGPSLVIAGAGSGKTRVLTYKIAYLLDQGYEPWSVLAPVSYTHLTLPTNSLV